MVSAKDTDSLAYMLWISNIQRLKSQIVPELGRDSNLVSSPVRLGRIAGIVDRSKDRMVGAGTWRVFQIWVVRVRNRTAGFSADPYLISLSFFQQRQTPVLRPLTKKKTVWQGPC